MRNKNFYSRRIGTVKIHTGKYDQKIEIHEIAKAKFSVYCLPEVRCLKINWVIITNKQNKQFSMKVPKNSTGPTMQLKGNTELVSPLKEIIRESAKIIVTNVLLHGCYLQVFCFYALAEEESDSSKSFPYYKLNKQFEWENSLKIICLGDFNASSSTTWFNSSLWENRIIENVLVNDSSVQFHKFCNNRCLSVLNTWISLKNCCWITWHSPDQVTKKSYDFVLACSWLCQYVSNCRVYNSYDFDLDNHLVMVDICTPCTKVARYVKWGATSTKNYVGLNCVKQPDIIERFVNTTIEKLENLDLTQLNL